MKDTILPVANHSLPGSTATQRTQPRCPDITLNSFHGACHLGRGMVGALRGAATNAVGVGTLGALYGSIAPSEPSAADSAISVKLIWNTLSHAVFFHHCHCASGNPSTQSRHFFAYHH